jgi:hypothetical protein
MTGKGWTNREVYVGNNEALQGRIYTDTMNELIGRQAGWCYIAGQQ